MRTLGPHAARRSRPHFPQACPFFSCRGRRRGLAILAGAPPLPSVSSGVDNPPLRARQVQLVWSASPQQPRGNPPVGSGAPERSSQQLRDAVTPAVAAPSQLDYAAAVELMRRIKAARSWQQLQTLVDENLPSMNHLHVSAAVTHMAQLHASSSISSITSNGDSNTGSRRGDAGSGVASNYFPAGSHLDDLWQHLDGADVAADAYQHHRNQSHHATTVGAGPFRFSKDGSRNLRNQTRQPAESSRRLVAPEVPEEHQLLHQDGTLPLPLHTAVIAADSRTRPQSSASHHQDTQGGALQHPLLLPPSHQQQQHRGTDPRVIFLQRLERAVAAHLPKYEGRQLANTLWAMAKLGHRPSEKWLEVVLTRASSQLHTFNPQHLANTLYALMLLRYMPPPTWLEDFYAAVDRRLHGFGPGELSHLCYAAGKLGLQPGRKLLGGVLHHSMIHMQAYGVRELALLVYGVVHMGARLHADWLRVYRKRVTGLVIESGALPARFLERLAEQLSRQQQLDLAELAQAQLRTRQKQQQYPPRQHHQHHIHQTSFEQQQKVDLPGQGSSHDVTDACPSVTRGGGDGGARPGASPASSTLEPLLPPSLTCSSVGGSTVDMMSTTAVTTAASAAWAPVSSSPRAARVASYLPTVLCSLAEVGYRPPPIFLSTVLAAVGSCAGQLTSVGLTTVLLSLANMRYQPHPALFWRVWNLLMDSLESLETQQCTVAIWASAILGCDTPRGDVAAILANAAARLPDHSDRELLQLLEAVSALGFEPTTSWLELLESDLYNRLPRMQPAQVAVLLLPLAGLGHKPHRLWMSRWAEALATGLPELGLRHMAAAAYGAARLGFRPPSQLRAELLTATAVGMCTATAISAPIATQKQEEEERQLSRLGDRHGDEPKLKLPRRARAAWERRQGDRAHSSRQLPEALTRLLWALAVLDIRPDADWLLGYMECLRFVREDLSSQERAKVVWALARFRYDPGPEWAQELVLWQDEARLLQQEQQQREGLLRHNGRGSASPDEPAAAVMALNSRGNDEGAAVAAVSGADPVLSGGGLVAAAVTGLPALTVDSAAGTAGAIPEAVTADLADTEAPPVHCVDHGSSSNRRSSVSSSSGIRLDMNALVLQGIQEWASRQLSNPESSAGPRRRRRRLVGGVR